jgi:hypothetical protein
VPAFQDHVFPSEKWPETGKGGFRRPELVADLLGPYIQDIKLTPFTMPSFEIFYIAWNEGVGGIWEGMGG